MLSKEKINFYRFLALKLVDDDIYPHYKYGRKFSLAEIKVFWTKTVKAIIEKKAPQKLGLYVHIPFCRQKCAYCMCDSYVPASYAEVASYLAMLKREIDTFSPFFKKVKFTSIYFGGGSPSFLKIEDLDGLFRYIYQNFGRSQTCQIIFEGTPTDLNEKYIGLLARYGVNRLTIGIQSLDPVVIKNIRRPQTKEKFIKVVRDARRAGIPYINIDLIAGLEGQTVASFIKDVKLALDLKIDMIHANDFSPFDWTPFHKERKCLSPADIRLRDEMMIAFEEMTKNSSARIQAEDGAGYAEDAANIQETDLRKENSSLLGIGYSAQSHAFAQAWYEHPGVTLLKSAPRYDRLPVFKGVVGSLDEEMRKFIHNNLQRGFSLKLFRQLFNNDALSVFKEEFSQLINLGKIKIAGDRVISMVGPRKEFLVYSKIFYSRERIKAILAVHGKSYRKDRDYLRDLDNLYADSV